MDTLLDTALPTKFCPSMPAAQQQASREAADTGGIVLRVKSIRIDPHCSVFTGLIPSAAVVSEHLPESSAYLRPRSIGTLHLTWSSLLYAGGEDIGYLVLQTPVASAGLLHDSEDGNDCWVAISIQRIFHTLKAGSIGAVCCGRCYRPIPPERLLAMPNTRLCINCQHKKENP